MRDGLDIAEKPLVLFRMRKGKLPQVRPEPGANITDFLRLVNLRGDDDRLLLVVSIISMFVPGIEHPILYFYGEQNTGKCLLSEFIKNLCDPASAILLPLPEDLKEMGLHAFGHHVLVYDNISAIPPSLWVEVSLLPRVLVWYYFTTQ